MTYYAVLSTFLLLPTLSYCAYRVLLKYLEYRVGFCLFLVSDMISCDLWL